MPQWEYLVHSVSRGEGATSWSDSAGRSGKIPYGVDLAGHVRGPVGGTGCPRLGTGLRYVEHI